MRLQHFFLAKFQVCNWCNGRPTENLPLASSSTPPDEFTPQSDDEDLDGDTQIDGELP